MKEFIVLKREVNIVAVKIKADNREEAVQKVSDYEGKECSTEYSHTLATDTWSVEDDGTTYYHNESNGKYDKCIGSCPSRNPATGTRCINPAGHYGNMHGDPKTQETWCEDLIK